MNPRMPEPQSGALTSFATPTTIGVPTGIRTPDTRLRRPLLYPAELWAQMERVKGIEPSRLAWKARALPLSYTRSKRRSEVRNQRSENNKFGLRISDFRLLVWSGRRDSNSRPPGPKPGALPNCATPRKLTRYIVTSISLDVNILFLKNIRSLTSFYRQCQ